MLKKISDYRNQLMGIAIVMVVIYHSNFQINISLIGFFKRILYSGVDIFMFVSGFGIYYSLSKSKQGFLIRRLKKILPAYVPILVIWTLFNCKNTNLLKLIKIFVLNLSGVSFWLQTEPSFNWYIQAIWLFYMAAIPLYYCIEKDSKKIDIILIIFTIAISVLFFNNYTLMAASRLTIFTMGMICGRTISKDVERKLSEEFAAYFCAAMALIFMFFSFSELREFLRKYGLYWYPFIFITPGTILLLCRIFGNLKKFRIGRMISRLFSSLGEVSIEIYLIHIVVYEQISQNTYSNISWFAIIILMLMLGELYGQAVKFVRRIFDYIVR